MEEILITGATIVNADQAFEAEVCIKNGLVKEIAPSVYGFAGSQVIDARGKYLIPGAIDPHVHLHLPSPAGYSCDDFISGSKAALVGGTTTLIDFVTPGKNQPLTEALEIRRKEAEVCLTRLFFHQGVTSWNNRTAFEMEKCVRDQGIFSFKIYLAYRQTIGINIEEAYQVMRVAAGLGAVVLVHAEEGNKIEEILEKCGREGLLSPDYHAVARPSAFEAEAVRQIIEITRQTRCRTYFVHITCEEAIRQIEAAQKDNLPVYAETCPQYLLFDDSVYKQEPEKVLPFILSPPIRGATDQESLWDAVNRGILSVVSTDHCPFNLKGQKNNGLKDFRRIPNGVGGIEYRPALLFTYGVLQGKISLTQWVSLLSASPAGIFGLSGQSGEIAEGRSADIVLWDPDYQTVVHAKEGISRCDHSIYEGKLLKGKAIHLI